MDIYLTIDGKEYKCKVGDRVNVQKDTHIDVLGTKYTIIKHNKDNPIKVDECDGYCDYTVKEIHITEMEDYEWADVDAHANKVIRHELVHAFLYESGLNSESWARNEEIVDWMAIQIPKIADKYNELDI